MKASRPVNRVLLACIIPLLLSLAYGAKGQTKTISINGKVVDSASNKLLEDATIVLRKLSGSKVYDQAVSGKNGFTFGNVAPGKYLLTTNYIGYSTDSLVLTILEDKKPPELVISMRVAGRELKEFVVKAPVPPVLIKSDTVVYNVSEFATKPYATVEDLLKKLPGIQVDSKGNITAQGKKVEKINIDGEEFFLNDPALVLKNLTADMLLQVEAMDARSERAKLTGIPDENPNKVLNLRMKQSKKPKFIGTAEASYGTEETMGLQGNIMRFMGNPMMFLNATMDRNALRSASAINANVRKKWGKRSSVTVNFGRNGGGSDQYSQSLKQTFLGDSTLTENRMRSSNSDNKAYSTGLLLETQIDTFSSIRMNTAVNFNNGSNASLDTVSVAADKTLNSYMSSRGNTSNTSSQNGLQFNNSINYNRRFRKQGRTFMASLNASFNQQKSNSGLNTLLNAFNPDNSIKQQTIVNQQSMQENGAKSYGIGLNYTEPLAKGKTLEASYQYSYSNNNSDRNSYNYNPATGHFDQADTLTTNDFTNTNITQRGGLSYNTTVGKLRYTVGASVQSTDQLNRNNTKHTDLDQNLVNWSPRASVNYNIDKGKSLSIGYSGNSSPPSIEQLQPLPDITNPYLITIGNPDLKPQFTHTMNMGYQGMNMKTFNTFMAQFSGSYTSNKITPFTTVDNAGVQKVQYVNRSGSFGFNGNVSYGFPLLKQEYGNGNLGTNMAYSRDVTFMNGQESIRNNLNVSQSIGVNFMYADKVYTMLNANLNYNSSRYNVGKISNTSAFSQSYACNVSYLLPLSIRVETDCNWQITGAQGSLPGNSVLLWNASVVKPVFKKKNGELRVSGIDLLNRSNGYNQYQAENYITSSTSRVIGNVFKVSFLYRFNVSNFLNMAPVAGI